MIKLIFVAGNFILFTFSSCSSADFVKTDVKFSSQTSTLAGTLRCPAGSGPFPAVIVVHGSRNHTRDYYTEYSDYFAENGIAVLNYDKRGFGKSGGNLWLSDFYDLAADIVASKQFLMTRPEIDSRRIGIWADSQGGWIALIADSLDNDFDFIINKAGPAVTPREQIRYDIENNDLIPAGLQSADRRKVLNLYESIWTYLLVKRDSSLARMIYSSIDSLRAHDNFSDFFDAYYLQLLYPKSGLPPREQVPIDPAARNLDFDPLPFYRRTDTRILVIYGTSDKLNDVDRCIRRIQSLKKSNIRLKVYAGADHGLRIHLKPDFLFGTVFPKNYLETLAGFILGHNHADR